MPGPAILDASGGCRPSVAGRPVVFIAEAGRVPAGRPDAGSDDSALVRAENMTIEDVLRRKALLRREVMARRHRQPDRDRHSREIWQQFAVSDEYATAAVVMVYLDYDSEARTRPFVPELWQSGRRVVIPYCVGDQLETFLFRNFGEVAPATRGILEPIESWRSRRERAVDPAQIDLVIVPGVAFDRRGGRIGYGRGYYDRFLRRLRPDARSVALAFECQLVEDLPLLPHDVRIDRVVTECAVYG